MRHIKVLTGEDTTNQTKLSELYAKGYHIIHTNRIGMMAILYLEKDDEETRQGEIEYVKRCQHKFIIHPLGGLVCEYCGLQKMKD